MANQIKISFKEFRESFQLTQVELAKKLKVSQATITDIESGRIGVSKRVIKKISEVFSLPADWYKQYEQQTAGSNRQNEVVNNKWSYCPHCGKALK